MRMVIADFVGIFILFYDSIFYISNPRFSSTLPLSGLLFAVVDDGIRPAAAAAGGGNVFLMEWTRFEGCPNGL